MRADLRKARAPPGASFGKSADVLPEFSTGSRERLPERSRHAFAPVDLSLTIMRDYGTIPTSFWTADAPRLSNEGKLLALYMLAGPHTTQIGCFRLPDGYVSEDLSWPLETVAKGFAELFENGFATRDEPSKWVLIHRFLEANRIENPNQGKSAARLFAKVPDDAGVKALLAKVLRGLAPHFPVEELNRFETLPERFPKGRRNQEQEQEQDQEQEQEDPFQEDEPREVELDPRVRTQARSAAGWDDDAPFGRGASR